MRAVVLVGGEGTRLRPLTLTRPKPMLPVAGVPMLARKLAHLAEHGVTEAVLSLGYKPDAFTTAFPEGHVAGVKLHYAVEPEPLDTAGAIRFAADAAGFLDGDNDEPIVAVNGDVLTSLDLSEQVAFHRSVGARATIALTQVEDPSAFGVVPCHGDGRVIDFVEKPKREEAPTDWINGGTYVLERSVIRDIAPGVRVSIERVIFPQLVAEGSLYAVQSSEPWIDAGIPSTYLQANLDAIALDDAPSAGLVDPSASIDPTAIVEQSVIGPGCVVAHGAIVRRSVLLRGTAVASGCVIEDSMLGETSRIESGSKLSALSVVGDGAIVEAGSVLVGARHPS
jgi:mannose-1-phosphate guanylyltransferase